MPLKTARVKRTEERRKERDKNGAQAPRLSMRSLAAFAAALLDLGSLNEQDGYNDRVKDAWDQNTEKLFDERYRRRSTSIVLAFLFFLGA